VFHRGFREGLVQAPGQPEPAGIIADGDKVDIPLARGRDEPQQVAHDLAVCPPRHEGSIAEFDDEHRMVQVTGQVPVPPEPFVVPQDLAQVGLTGAPDPDVAHRPVPSLTRRVLLGPDAADATSSCGAWHRPGRGTRGAPCCPGC
jgi:hypothetical protein